MLSIRYQGSEIRLAIILTNNTGSWHKRQIRTFYCYRYVVLSQCVTTKNLSVSLLVHLYRLECFYETLFNHQILEHTVRKGSTLFDFNSVPIHAYINFQCKFFTIVLFIPEWAGIGEDNQTLKYNLHSTGEFFWVFLGHCPVQHSVCVCVCMLNSTLYQNNIRKHI